MKIAVFCSANNHIDPDYFRMTEELGAWMAAEGHTLVFGGCNSGLMECAAKAVKEHGGHTIGVVPSIIEQGIRRSNYLDVDIPCDNLSDRKDLMVAHADAFIALPGGVGTLDEVFSVVSSATIGYHLSRVVLYNMKGFWQSLIALLDDLQQRGLIRGSWRDHIIVANSLDEVRAALA